MIPPLGEQLQLFVYDAAISTLQPVCDLIPRLSSQITCGESLGTRLSCVPQLYPLSKLPGINFDAIFVS